MHNDVAEKQIRKVYVGIVVMCLIAYLARPFFGVELSDELYNISEIYGIWIGREPFIDSWNVTFAGFTVPFFDFYYNVVQGFQGIVLYYRFLYIAHMALLVVILCFLLKRSDRVHIGHPVRVLLPVFFVVPFSLFEIGYNTVLADSHLLAAALLYTDAYREFNYWRYAMMGGIMAMGTIGYPPMIISTFLIALLIWFANKGYHRGKKTAIYLLVGSVVVGGYFLWLVSNGSVAEIQQTIYAVVHSPHEARKIGGLRGVWTVYIRPFLKSVWMVPFYFFCVGQLLIKKFVFDANKQKDYCLRLYFIFVATIGLMGHVQAYFPTEIFLATILTMYLMSLLNVRKHYILWSILVMGLFVYNISSDNQSTVTAMGVFSSMLYLIIGVIWDDQDNSLDKAKWIVSALLCFAAVLGTYTYVYRDVYAWQTNSIVDKGIYRGLRTTVQRKDYVENIEFFLQENIDPNQTVCTATIMPYAYLMARARICAPATWDPQGIREGMETSAYPLTRYFDAKKEMPDIFIESTEKISDIYPNDKYKINEFLEENYHIKAQTVIANEKVIIWSK